MSGEESSTEPGQSGERRRLIMGREHESRIMSLPGPVLRRSETKELNGITRNKYDAE
jgi:hypothetical protein